ncbi:MAG: class I SAM-dependent methyltransferase [Sphingomonadaceae bacterium]|nr:class I SAM-dependent methyltransferase [Sphingomonadaceae bacterium]
MPNSLLPRAANLLGKPFGLNPYPRAFNNASTEGEARRERAFDNIFKNSGWASSESRSGPGSELHRTRRYANELRNYLDTTGARKVFDAPCGDLNWILPAVAGKDYVGGDISPALIANLQTKHPELDTRRFDICEDEFPDADVWHCRDCLFHLPFSDIESALVRFAASSIPIALLTTHWTAALHTNVDVPVGGWRYLDLRKAPISLPQPQQRLRDYRFMRDFPRYVGVWSREQIKQAIQRFRT